MTPDQAPATKQDLTELEARVVDATKRDMAELETRLVDKLAETMREMQSEILRGLERFARGNFAHFHRLDTAEATTNERLTALEERVIALETRPPR